jgi:hypothetical protein
MTYSWVRCYWLYLALHLLLFISTMTREPFDYELTEFIEIETPSAPGGEQAIRSGCKCNAVDNRHGYGCWLGKGVYIVDANCRFNHKQG